MPIEGIAFTNVAESNSLLNSLVRLSRALGNPRLISAAEHQCVEAALVDAAALMLTANPTWSEPREREMFESRSFAHYERVRQRRVAAGMQHPDDEPGGWSRESLFSRTPSGDYIAVAMQHAWGGWKLARGGL